MSYDTEISANKLFETRFLGPKFSEIGYPYPVMKFDIEIKSIEKEPNCNGVT
jgi:hypothetical protein